MRAAGRVAVAGYGRERSPVLHSVAPQPDGRERLHERLRVELAVRHREVPIAHDDERRGRAGASASARPDDALQLPLDRHRARRQEQLPIIGPNVSAFSRDAASACVSTSAGSTGGSTAMLSSSWSVTAPLIEATVVHITPATRTPNMRAAVVRAVHSTMTTGLISRDNCCAGVPSSPGDVGRGR